MNPRHLLQNRVINQEETLAGCLQRRHRIGSQLDLLNRRCGVVILAVALMVVVEAGLMFGGDGQTRRAMKWIHSLLKNEEKAGKKRKKEI